MYAHTYKFIFIEAVWLCWNKLNTSYECPTRRVVLSGFNELNQLYEYPTRQVGQRLLGRSVQMKFTYVYTYEAILKGSQSPKGVLAYKYIHTCI